MADQQPTSEAKGTERKEGRIGPEGMGPTLAVTVLVALIIIALMSLAALTGRMEMRANAARQIDKINARLAGMVSQTTPDAMGQSVDASVKDNAPIAFRNKQQLLLDLTEAEYDISELDDFDSGRGSFVWYFRHLFASVPNGGTVNQEAESYLRQGFFGQFDQSTLLALTVMTCAAIGSLIAGLRAEGRIPTKSLFLGLASGFVVFLTIKGGQFLFIIRGGEASTQLNPYGSAFAGVVVGLFTERAYKLIGALVEDLAVRIETAVKGGQNGASEKSRQSEPKSALLTP